MCLLLFKWCRYSQHISLFCFNVQPATNIRVDCIPIAKSTENTVYQYTLRVQISRMVMYGSFLDNWQVADHMAFLNLKANAVAWSSCWPRVMHLLGALSLPWSLLWHSGTSSESTSNIPFLVSSYIARCPVPQNAISTRVTATIGDFAGPGLNFDRI